MQLIFCFVSDKMSSDVIIPDEVFLSWLGRGLSLTEIRKNSVDYSVSRCSKSVEDLENGVLSDSELVMMNLDSDHVLASYDMKVSRFGYFGFRREPKTVKIDGWDLFVEPFILCVACAKRIKSMGVAIMHEAAHGIDVSTLQSYNDSKVLELFSHGYLREAEMVIPRRMQRLCLAHSIPYLVDNCEC